MLELKGPEEKIHAPIKQAKNRMVITIISFLLSVKLSTNMSKNFLKMFMIENIILNVYNIFENLKHIICKISFGFCELIIEKHQKKP